MRFLLLWLLLACNLVIGQQWSVAQTAPPAKGQPPNPTEPSRNPGEGKRVDAQARPESTESKKEITPDAEVGLIGAVIGAVIGGAIAWFAGIKTANRAAELEKRRDRENEKERDATVKAMLDVEIELNLQMLRDEKTRLEAQPADASAFEWLSYHPCPKWSTVVWEQSILLVHRAIPSQKIIAIQTLYNSLHSLTVAREGVAAVIARGQHHQALVPYTRAKELMESVLKAGNPLGTS